MFLTPNDQRDYQKNNKKKDEFGQNKNKDKNI
jgi:hypothetical protein